MKDPARYLNEQKIDVRCVVNAGRNSNPDSKRCAYVNHEIYFLSDAKALRRFRGDPLRYCGTVTDPVNRVRFKPTPRSPRWDYAGRPYFFTQDSTLAVFQSMPDSFAVRKGM